MSLSPAAIFDDAPAPAAAKAAPRHERLRMIECAKRRQDGATVAQLAWYYNVSASTIHRWTTAAYTFSDPEAAILRGS